MRSTDRARAREINKQVRTWRRDRANTTLYEQLSEAYIWVFSALLIGAMGISALIQTRVNVADECTSATCGDARTALLWTSTIGTLGLVVAVAGALGPVMVSAAAGSWLLSTPLDRRPLLRTRLVMASVLAAAIGAAVIAVAALLAGLSPGALAVWAGCTALAAAALTLLAAWQQSRSAPFARWTAMFLLTVAWIATVLVAFGATPATSADWLKGPAGVAVLVAAGIVAVLLGILAMRHISDLRRADLTGSGTVMSSMSGALAGLDFALAYDVLVARKWRHVATVRPVRGGPGGAWALVWRDVVRLRRSPGALTVLGSTLVVPYVLVALDLYATIIPLSALTALLCGLWLFPALRTVANSPGLVRSFPMPMNAVRAATLAVPGTVVVLWAVAAAPAISHGVVGTPGETLLVAFATGTAALGAIARLLLAGPPDYSTPLVTSPAGAVPPGLLISSLRGFDVLALLTVPLLISPTADGSLVSLGLCGAVMAFLLLRRR